MSVYSRLNNRKVFLSNLSLENSWAKSSVLKTLRSPSPTKFNEQWCDESLRVDERRSGWLVKAYGVAFYLRIESQFFDYSVNVRNFQKISFSLWFHSNLSVSHWIIFMNNDGGKLTAGDRKEIKWLFSNRWLTCPIWSMWLLVNFIFWKETTWRIHCDPVPGESGWTKILVGIRGSALPVTDHSELWNLYLLSSAGMLSNTKTYSSFGFKPLMFTLITGNMRL